MIVPIKPLNIQAQKEGLASDTVYGILKDIKGNTWISGPSLGVDRIDSAKQIILHAGVKEGLSDENIVDIKTDKQGKVWLATNSKGVDVIDPVNGTLQNLRQGPGLQDTCNRLLMPDKQGRMWIGTDKGIYIADMQKGTLTSISTTEGLSNNIISSLITYNGQVLAGTQNQVSHHNPSRILGYRGYHQQV